MMDRDGAWLTPREAGTMLGISEQAVLLGIDDGRYQTERVPTPHGPVWLVWVVAGWTAGTWGAALAQESDAAAPVTLAPSDSPEQPEPETVAPSPVASVRPGPGRHERTFEERVNLGASRLHIPVEEYRAHIDAGERWCSWHRQWHPAELMVRAFGRPQGFGAICRKAARERNQQQARATAP